MSVQLHSRSESYEDTAFPSTPATLQSSIEYPLIRETILGSGSAGNACVFENGETMILVDAGLSCGQINKRMQSRGLDPQDLDACLVTHEHTDHILGLRVLAARYQVPLFFHPATHNATRQQLAGSEMINYFELGEIFELGSIEIQSVPTLHDAAAPTGFLLRSKGVSVGYLTDLGAVTEDNFLMMREVDHLVMEANHDREMLWEGPYPPHLKRRVDSRHGHLSNDDSAEFIHLLNKLGRLRSVTLAHLSEQNNRPAVARSAVESKQDREIQLRIAQQANPLETLTVESAS